MVGQRRITYMILLSATLSILLIGLGITTYLHLFTPSSQTQSATVAGQPPDGLHIQGTHILDRQNHIIIPHGLNRSGPQYQCTKSYGSTFDGPADQASITAMQSWHITIVRIPLNEDCWLGINGEPADGTTSTQYQQAIINYVHLLNQNNLMVILELHWNAPGSQQALGQQPMPDADHAPAFWHSVAETFKSNTSIMFDLYNEPYTKSWACWRNGSGTANAAPCTDVNFAVAGMQSLIQTVRASGAHNLILLGGLNYAADLSQWWQSMPVDPDQNSAADFHSYNCAACAQTQISSLMTHVPIIVSELGEMDCKQQFVDKIMPWFDQHTIGYLAWAWDTGSCTGTPALISNYNGNPTPYGLGIKNHFASLA